MCIFSSRSRQTVCSLVTEVQTCALPILLWASTGTKNPKAPDTLYIEALAAPDTINTMPEKTLRAFADHGTVRGAMAEDGGDCAATLEKIAAAGVDIDTLAAQLQREGARSAEHTYELQSLMRTSYAVFCLKKKKRY